MSTLTDYYVRQAQTGSGMSYFAGSSSQKGAGIGSFLGGLFRSIFPIVKQGAEVVGREALRAGSHILADVVSGEVPLKNSVRQHFGQVGKNLASRMSGNGIKRKRNDINGHFGASARAERFNRNKKKKLDIDTEDYIF